MNVIKGKGVSNGVAIGRMKFLGKTRTGVKRIHSENSEAEMSRFENAKQQTLAQLEQLYQKAVVEVGEANAQIFEIHQMMVEDEDYLESIENIIRSQSVNAEYAVACTGDNFAEMFSSMDDEYMKARSADVLDISDRIVKNLTNAQTEDFSADEKLIICADDLTPSETVQMDKSKVLAFVTRNGSSNSHTAILARTMSIPAVIGTGEQLPDEYDGADCIVDAFTGEVYVNPDKETAERLTAKREEDIKRRELIRQLKGKENITLDGKKIKLYANIGGLSDVGEALRNDAGGIGLFRSEFLYLESKDYPTEETQFAVYKSVAENMAGKPVIIRTMDIGADKRIDYFNMPYEENPALGWRALRICLDRSEIFKTQLKALCRASAYGNIQIMIPMITSVWEIREVRKLVSEVQSQLRAGGISFNENMPVGVMIETPAAAIISDKLAKEADFFSIGTNDLTQYTLACDRQNPRLEKYCNVYHPAILRLIKLAVDNAHAEGKWCGICGELGGDVKMTEQFLAMGVDELSMVPSLILEVRDKVRKCDTSKLDRNILSDIE